MCTIWLPHSTSTNVTNKPIQLVQILLIIKIRKRGIHTSGNRTSGEPHVSSWDNKQLSNYGWWREEDKQKNRYYCTLLLLHNNILKNCTIGPEFDIFTKTFKNLSFKLDRVVDWFLLWFVWKKWQVWGVHMCHQHFHHLYQYFLHYCKLLPL